MSESRAFSVTADGLTYAGIEWGEPDGYPILALHGWLDNALSFSVLAPFLSEYRLIALDLSGQGLSDHRSLDATYHIGMTYRSYYRLSRRWGSINWRSLVIAGARQSRCS